MKHSIFAGFIVCGLLFAQGEFTTGPALDAAIGQAVKEDLMPGAVLLVGQNGKIVYQKAYGWRSLTPRKEPMTMDTIFDSASLTKVIATTSCIMKLVEEGKLRLADKVTVYLPEFQNGKSDITVKQLLTHFSGLRPDLDLLPEWSGYKLGIQKALNDKPASPPGTSFVYSDINFILLCEIIQRMSEESLPAYAQRKIFGPLGMFETMYQPPATLIPRIAPTEGTPPLRGVVHDPTTRYMGGISGHAGLFTTAADLAKFAAMMVGMGEREGVRIFSPLTVRTFTSPQTPTGQPVLRGYGWDIDSPFSANRGELYPTGSYGHTGFTGTSLWIDPSTKSFVILLANSVHPNRRPPITSLRGRVASMVAAGLSVDIAPAPATFSQRPPLAAVATTARNAEVLTGLDVLAQNGFQALKGKRVGLITNHTGITRDGKRNIDVMVAAGVNLKALYSPEHGLAGKEDKEDVANTKDEPSGLPVYSLYLSGNRSPSSESLRNIDVLVFDIQDIGVRFYTYACTMANAMEEAAKRKLPFMVLDRPNPINGVRVEGPMLDPDLKSFIGCSIIPVRHGMTVGEFAQMKNSELQPKADLQVIAMKNWQRADWFDSTGLPWVNPSPNMRSLNAAVLYPGIGMLEGGTVYSVGRGTDAPFEQIGAAWMRGRELANYLNARQIPGIRVYPTNFQPTSSNFSAMKIEGVRFVITDRDMFSSTEFGIELGVALAKLFPGKMDWNADLKLLGNKQILKAIEAGEDPAGIGQSNLAGLNEFIQRRKSFLLY